MSNMQAGGLSNLIQQKTNLLQKQEANNQSIQKNSESVMGH